MDNAALTKICARIDGYSDEAIRIETDMTAIPALGPENGGEGEYAKAQYLLRYVKDELGCNEAAVYDAPDSRVPSGVRPNIVARFKGKSNARTIWIMSHMDVVPPGDLNKWESDPWTVRVEDGKLYGRGTEDNQQGIVSSLLTVKAFRDEDILPEYDIALLLVSDEETGSGYGIQYLLKQHGELFTHDDFILIPDAGNEQGTLVEIAEKSIVWFKFTVRGKQTHGSTPELGVNAFKAGAHLVVQLNELYTHFDKSDPVFEPPISTFEPTKKEANVPNVNTIPGEDIFYYDCRLLPNYDVKELRDKIRKICAAVEQEHHVKVEIGSEQEVIAPPPTPADAPVVKAVRRAISEIKDIEAKPMGIGGGTVAAFFRQAGFHAVVWATQDETLHEPNEYVKIDNILGDARIFAHIALQP